MDVVRQKYTMAKERLKRILAENKTKYSLTTGIWTSFANDAYISLTTMMTVGKWGAILLLHIHFLSSTQVTTLWRSKKLKEVISEFNDINNSIFAIVHDQGSNFQQVGHLLEDDKQWKSVNCAAHCLQLCVIEGFSINTIAQALAAAKTSVKHFHHSARATEELQKKQESTSQPKRKLINDCKTRWNSTYYMCQSLLWPNSAVLADESVTRVEHRRLDLTTTRWELLGDLVKILHP